MVAKLIVILLQHPFLVCLIFWPLFVGETEVWGGLLLFLLVPFVSSIGCHSNKVDHYNCVPKTALLDQRAHFIDLLQLLLDDQVGYEGHLNWSESFFVIRLLILLYHGVLQTFNIRLSLV